MHQSVFALLIAFSFACSGCSSQQNDKQSPPSNQTAENEGPNSTPPQEKAKPMGAGVPQESAPTDYSSLRSEEVNNETLRTLAEKKQLHLLPMAKNATGGKVDTDAQIASLNLRGTKVTE